MKEFLKKKLSTLNFQFSTPEGFTLVELVVAFGIAAILATMGLAAFTSFNQRQQLATSQQNLANLFHTARSRSLAQVKPNDCGNHPIAGYNVILCDPNGSDSCAANTLSKYDAQLQVECPEGTVHPLSGIHFSSSLVSYNTTGTPQRVFSFRVITGGVKGAASSGTPITLERSFLTSITRVIIIYQDGRISLQ